MPEINTPEYYLKQQSKFKCKRGDKVKVIGKCESREGGWQNSWEPRMTQSIGHFGTITEIGVEGIHLKEYCASYPYFVLEILK
jgi:hypothetical protein